MVFFKESIIIIILSDGGNQQQRRDWLVEWTRGPLITFRLVALQQLVL